MRLERRPRGRAPNPIVIDAERPLDLLALCQVKLAERLAAGRLRTGSIVSIVIWLGR